MENTMTEQRNFRIEVFHKFPRIVELLSKEISNLSDSELDELWSNVRKIYTQDNEFLLAVIQLVVLCMNLNGNNTLKDFPQNYVPNDLVHIVLTLQNLLKGDISLEIQEEIVCLLEGWCLKRLVTSHILCAKVFECLLHKYGNNVKRIWRFFKVLKEFQCSDTELDSCQEQLLKFCENKVVVTQKEGQQIIAYFLCLNAQFFKKLHEQIKNALPKCSKEQASAYGNVYCLAICGSTEPMREMLKDVCLQDLIEHTLKSRRHVMNFTGIGPQLIQVLRCIHAQKHQRKVALLLVQVYRPIIFRYLMNSNNIYRCNAAEVMFDVYPLVLPGGIGLENRALMKQQHEVISKLLYDECHVVRIIAVRETCRVMSVFWHGIAIKYRNTWLRTILSDLSMDSSSPEVRRSVYHNLSKLVEIPEAALFIRSVLPALKENIHDSNQRVRSAFLEMLLCVKRLNIMNFYRVVPTEHMIARLEIEGQYVGEKLVSLLYSHILSPKQSKSESLKRIKRFALKNLTAMRNFFHYSSHILTFQGAFDLIKVILVHLKLNVRTCNKENSHAGILSWNPIAVRGLLDAVSVLWVLHAEELGMECNRDKQTILNILVKNVYPTVLRFYKDSDWGVLSSALFLGSLIPANLLRSVTTGSSFCISRLRSITLDESAREKCLVLSVPLCSWGRQADLLNLAWEWLDEAFRTEQLNESVTYERKRRKVHFHGDSTKPLLALTLLDAILGHLRSGKQFMRNVVKVEEFWNYSKRIKLAVEKRKHGPLSDPLSDDFLRCCLLRHAKLIPLLGKYNSDFLATNHMCDLLQWSIEVLVPPGVPLAMNMLNDMAQVADNMIAIGLTDDPFIECVLDFTVELLKDKEYSSMFAVSAARIVYRLVKHCEAYCWHSDPLSLVSARLPNIMVKILTSLESENAGAIKKFRPITIALDRLLMLGIHMRGPLNKSVCTLVSYCIDAVVGITMIHVSKMPSLQEVMKIKDLPFAVAQLLAVFRSHDVLGMLFLCFLARRFHVQYAKKDFQLACAVHVLHTIVHDSGILRPADLKLAGSAATMVLRFQYPVMSVSNSEDEGMLQILEAANTMAKCIQEKLQLHTI